MRHELLLSRTFPTKQDREEEWAIANAQVFLPKLKAKLQEDDISILLPSVLWNIIIEYAQPVPLGLTSEIQNLHLTVNLTPTN